MGGCAANRRAAVFAGFFPAAIRQHGGGTYAAHYRARMAETRRYPFQKPRGALVLVCASATRNETTGEWEGEPGQLQSLAAIREQCIERGFTVIEELGTSSSAVGKPTANDIRQLLRRLSERDFSENDALMMVIGSHGYEGHIRAWPNPGEDKTSGPVALRDEIFSLFQPPLHGTGTKASETLVGKPKIFLIDACRSPKGAEGTLTHVEDPLRPAVGREAKGVFRRSSARPEVHAARRAGRHASDEVLRFLLWLRDCTFQRGRAVGGP